MKARVKETGEIIEVHDCSADMYVEKFGEITGRVYHITELDFDNLDTPDYWTRLEHQYAGMAMQGILSNPNIAFKDIKVDTVTDVYVDNIVKISHALVEKYKKEE